MSMYYSPEVVKVLMEERLREAQDARRASSQRGSGLLSGLRDRFVRPQAPAPCAPGFDEACACAC